MVGRIQRDYCLAVTIATDSDIPAILSATLVVEALMQEVVVELVMAHDVNWYCHLSPSGSLELRLGEVNVVIVDCPYLHVLKTDWATSH